MATAFACSSSDVDEPRAIAGAGGITGGAGGASVAGGAGVAGFAGGAGADAGRSGGGAAGFANAGAAGADVAAGAPSAGAGGAPDAAAGSAGDMGNAGTAGAVSSEPQILTLSGAITYVHDPAIVKDGDTYYLFSTGQGVQLRTSTDLKSWKAAGQVFASKPAWITTTGSSDPNNLWAPEVLYFGGTFHLYYAASKFGVNQSCIGHATKASLASEESWVDLGAAYCSNMGGPAQDFNAIDPNPFQDQQGKLWLSFGSFWSGLKMLRLDSDGNPSGPDFFSLATRANTAVEAPYLFFHDGFYFLFESVDSCCQGSQSTYKIMVGRSTEVAGPYLDKSGVALSAGGGTLLVEGAGRWRGPGHNAILADGSRYLNIYHSYDANNGGVPTLRISELIWTDDNWPVSAGP